jgi:hypothetical protein
MISTSMLYLTILAGVAMGTNMRCRAFAATPKGRALSPAAGARFKSGAANEANASLPAFCHLYQLPRRTGLAHGPARLRWGSECLKLRGGKAGIGLKSTPRTTRDGCDRAGALVRWKAVTVRYSTASTKSAAIAAIPATCTCKTWHL